MYTEQS